MYRRFLLAASVLLTTALSGTVQAQKALPSYDLFYLSVGSSDYVQVSAAAHNAGLNSFGELEAASHSANTVADLLRSAGSPYGVTLTSRPGRYVTRRDVLAQLDSLILAVRRAGTARPFIIYYFSGHGLSEGIAWSHFSVPGDFTFRGFAKDLNVNDLSNRAIYTGEIFDILERSRIPFLMLLDNCVEGKAERFQYPELSQGAQESLRGVAAVMRHLNEFREPTPVVFAAEPGNTARTAADPRDTAGLISMGPIGRRMLLVFDDARNRGVSLTVSTLVGRLTSPATDPGTRPAVTRSDPAGRDGYLMRLSSSARGTHLERNGTGRQR